MNSSPSELASEPRALRRPVGEHTLRELARRIASARPDACVILFGSRARGQARPDSDVDLLVVTDTDTNPLRVAGELYLSMVDRDFGLDLVVVTPTRLAASRKGFDPFLQEVLTQGRILHGRLD